MKKNILIYNSSLLKGGTESYFINLIKSLPNGKFNIEVIIKSGDSVDKDHLETLQNLGIKVNLMRGGLISQMKSFKKFFKENQGKFDVIHINALSKGNGIISYFAKKFGKIPKVIFHSHMSGNDNDSKNKIIDFIGAKLLKKYSTDFVACSEDAYDYMFGKTFRSKCPSTVLNNSIDIEKFSFNPKVRDKMRDELKLDKDTFLLIHIGRFAYQKNHEFLIKLFSEFMKKEKNTKLILIGEGELKDEMKSLASELKITDNVLFAGTTTKVADYLQAADCFVFPSNHEGLGIVAVEAQASNLPVVASTNVPSEAQMNDNFVRLDLSEPYEEWINAILKFKGIKRRTCEKELSQKGYTNESATQKVVDLYNK